MQFYVRERTGVLHAVPLQNSSQERYKYMELVCSCSVGIQLKDVNRKDLETTQAVSHFWGLTDWYEALFGLVSCPYTYKSKEKRKKKKRHINAKLKQGNHQIQNIQFTSPQKSRKEYYSTKNLPDVHFIEKHLKRLKAM
jgi:hypothetical protein